MDGLAGLNNELEIARRDLSAPIGVLPKRIIDIALALSGIILLAPLLVICYLLMIATSPGPVLFRHRRVGFNGKHFDCLKFRTMLVDAPERLHHLLESDPSGGQRVGRDPEIAARPPHHCNWGYSSQVQPGRTAAVVQCPQGRHEHRRTAADHRRRTGAIYRLRGRLSCVPARNHGLVAGQRPKHDDV